MRVRILCGSYDTFSPFIEGGCATDWIEDLEGANDSLECPGCGQRCPEQILECAREMLATRIVFVFGCSHRAFTFSRREHEPYFYVNESSNERPGGGPPPDPVDS
ncbi:MAG TPA: hypothetical protein VMU54_22755 [Planctomycetota bacterium]|nr:hypothetical protein [Planctomycetota bacterium]